MKNDVKSGEITITNKVINNNGQLKLALDCKLNLNI